MRFKEHILNIIKEEHPISNGVEYKRLKAQLQDSIVCNAAVKADEVVYITYSSSGSYRIGENLTEQVENLMLSMDYRIAAVIHLGNPYAMERIVHVPRLILSVGGKENSVDHAVGVLAGEYEPKGKLPLDIKFN